jgi:hypothetical protein
MRFVDNLEIAPQDRIIELPDHFDDAAVRDAPPPDGQDGTDSIATAS